MSYTRFIALILMGSPTIAMCVLQALQAMHSSDWGSDSAPTNPQPIQPTQDSTSSPSQSSYDEWSNFLILMGATFTMNRIIHYVLVLYDVREKDYVINRKLVTAKPVESEQVKREKELNKIIKGRDEIEASLKKFGRNFGEKIPKELQKIICEWEDQMIEEKGLEALEGEGWQFVVGDEA